MCVNFEAPSRDQLSEYFDIEPPPLEWRHEVWQDYVTPIILAQDGDRKSLMASYGLIPKDKCPPGVRLTTMNARSETVGSLRTYRKPWANGQLCLVPMTAFYEPNYEAGKAIRWRIHRADDQPIAVAGIWQSWDMDTEEPRYSFTQLTINADDHPFMKRFHKPGDEKRSLVILDKKDWDDWLECGNPEIARTFLQPCPVELMIGEPRPVPQRLKK